MMETGPDPQSVENFLRLAKGAQSKQEFISRVREFDQKFLDSYPSPTMPPPPQIPKSSSSSQFNPQNKHQTGTPHKNPFIVHAEKYSRNQPKQNSFANMGLQNEMEQLHTRMAQGGVLLPTPHSRSETNFYRHSDYPQFREPEEYPNTYNHFGLEEHNYAQQYNLDRSYPVIPTQTPRQQRTTSIPGQSYAPPQPYVPTNQFLTAYQAEQPEYVRYYKKAKPDGNNNHKMGLGMAGRGNPFRQGL